MRALLFGLVGLTSCSLLFPRLIPPECSDGAPDFCRDGAIVSCQEGFETTTSCAEGEECSALVEGAACVAPVCGDGVLAAEEECDDANVNAGDGCDPFCNIEIATCGNNIVEVGESCDDGNLTNGDGCDDSCVLESCGDEALDAGEECDDGNRIDGDGCEGNCLLVCSQGSGAQRAFLGANDHCYLGFARANVPQDVISWPDAQADCEQLGGYLVTIEDAAENALARSTIPQQDVAPWIGLNDISIEEDLADGVAGDDFVWVNQQQTSFRTFGGGEPNNDGNEDCTHFFPSGVADPLGWNDNVCSGSAGIINTAFICEIEPVPCGDNVVQSARGEQCDDGNLSSGDGCDSSCQFEQNGVCGNTTIEPGEQCDDSNTTNGDGCSSTCQNEAGHFFEVEVNDDGSPALPPDPNNDPQFEGNDFSAAAANVLPSHDLLIHGAIEGLGDEDYFSFTNTTNAAIDLTAQIFLGGVGRCDFDLGDPVINVRDVNGNVLETDDDSFGLCSFSTGTVAPGETLFFGVMAFAEEETIPAYLFSFTACGDGTLVVAEQCDDGNGNNGDGCDTNCTASACGNGVQAPNEECEDGNAFGGDGCSAACTIEGCGDGTINNGFNGEQCDDGNNVNGDGCSSTCRGEPAFFCALATAVTDDIAGDNTGGSVAFEVSIDAPTCDVGDGEFGSEDVFTFVPTTSGQLQLALTSQDDLVLYARSSCADPQTQLDCADDEFSGTELSSFNVTAGDSITIFVDGFELGQDGPYTLNITPP